MTLIGSPSSRARSRNWRAPAVALALALGATLGGCGPSKQFCADASDNGYVCVPASDAAAPPSDANDAPPKQDAPIVIGDDESNDGGATAQPDVAPAN